MKTERIQNKNLKPFKKGKDARRNMKGNTNGAIVTDFKNYLREKLSAKLPNSDRTKLDAIVERMIYDAGQSKAKALELVLAYGFDRPSQPTELSGKLELSEPVIIDCINDNPDIPNPEAKGGS